MSPQWSDLILSADIPDIKLDILIRHSLDVEPDSRNGRDI